MVQLNPEMGRSHFISIRGAILVILNMKLDRAPFIANVLQNNPVILSRSGMKSWQRLKKKVVEHSIFSFNTGASRKSSNRFPIFIVINSVMVFCASGPRNQVSPIVKDLGVTRGFTSCLYLHSERQCVSLVRQAVPPKLSGLKVLVGFLISLARLWY